MIFTLASCSGSDEDKTAENSGSDQQTETVTDTVTETVTETTDETEGPAVPDVSVWNWVKGELDCYGYKYRDQAYYLSYSHPDNFKTFSEAYSGLQYFGYCFNPADSDASPNDSPYGLYIYFGQGSDGGATKSSLEEDVPGGLTERELGGRTVLFGELSPDPNTGSHTFAYYLSYEEDGWSRIWIIVSDPESDGEFRRTFENSMSFDP